MPPRLIRPSIRSQLGTSTAVPPWQGTYRGTARRIGQARNFLGNRDSACADGTLRPRPTEDRPHRVHRTDGDGHRRCHCRTPCRRALRSGGARRARPNRGGWRTNLQDQVVVHCDEGVPYIGHRVTVGHGAVVHAPWWETIAWWGLGPVCSTTRPLAKAPGWRRGRFSPKGLRSHLGRWRWAPRPVHCASYAPRRSNDNATASSGTWHLVSPTRCVRKGVGQLVEDLGIGASRNLASAGWLSRRSSSGPCRSCARTGSDRSGRGR